MLINGKDVNVNFRKAEEIQNRINLQSNLPDTTKVEVSKKDQKDILQQYDSLSGSSIQQFGDMFGTNNNTLLTGNNVNINRQEYYATFQEMSECNFIHRGLQIIADDGCQKNIEGDTVKVYSDDEEIKGTLEDLFHKRLNLNKELWSIFYETCKLGDNFYEVIPDSYEHPTQIARIRYLEPTKVNRIEKNGKLAFYTYMADAETNQINDIDIYGNKDEQKMLYKLEPWQIIHFKIADKDFYPYGGSLLKSGVKPYRRLSLLEDGMVIYRLARVPERRVFKIDIGNLSTSEGMRAVNKIKDNYRSNQVMDDKGNINKTAAALSLTQDIFIPVREGASGTSIETLQAGTGLQNIDDIKYFRDEILWTLNIPSEYLGLSQDSSGSQKGSLAMQDVKFARFVERIQYYIEEGLTKLASIELFFKHKRKDDLSNFRVELTPPSNVKEIMDIEYLSQKMQLISTMQSTQMFPTDYILKYVMKLSKKEISDLKFYKSLEAQPAQDNGLGMMGGVDMSGGMPMAGGADMGAGGMPTPDMGAAAQTPPAMSVTTENMVQLFGKDVLIENKKDFAKLMRAVEKYEKASKEEKEIGITNSNLIEELQEVMNGKEPEKVNSVAEALYYEGELGGLNYGKSFKIYSKPKKRSGPKGNSPRVITEEIIKEI